jgi:transcriptional regulator with XRE-family HTH domain
VPGLCHSARRPPEMARNSEPGMNAAAFLGGELKRARQAAGLTQEQVARMTGYDRTVITKAETGTSPPTLDVLSALIETLKPGQVLDTGEVIGRLGALVRQSGGIPAWFLDWVAVEAVATVIRWWEPLLIPGLLQTEQYARAVLGWGPDAGDDLDGKVAARLERQRIFEKETPPQVWMLLGEPVLSYCVGSADVMRKQVDHLCAMAQRPHVTIQVVPDGAAAYGGRSGAFAVAGVGPSDTAAYLETGVQGMTVRDPRLVGRAEYMFEHLRAEAVPRSQMLDLLKRAGERWNE